MAIPIISDNTAHFSNGKKVIFSWSRQEYCFEFDSCIFFILGSLDDNSRNIWCFDQEGNKLWEIEPSLAKKPYYSLRQNEQGQLIASDQEGFMYRVDMRTGFIECVGGDKVGDLDWPNTLIRQKREERLKAKRELK